MRKQLEKHKKKLENFKKDPDAVDNKGFLKGKTATERAKIIETRIKSLEKQIDNFQKQIDQTEAAENSYNGFVERSEDQHKR